MDGDRAGGFELGFRRVRWAGLGGPREAGGGALAHAGGAGEKAWFSLSLLLYFPKIENKSRKKRRRKEGRNRILGKGIIFPDSQK